jgi:hypothetical protein
MVLYLPTQKQTASKRDVPREKKVATAGIAE